MFRFIKQIFLRTWLLFFMIGGALFFLVNRSQISDEIINASRPGGNYVNSVAYGLKKFDSEEFQKAIFYYKTLLLSESWTPIAAANLGFCYYYLNDHLRAVESYQMAISKAPFIYTLYFDLGYIAMTGGDYVSALGHFKKSFDLYPNSLERLFRIFNISSKYKDWSQLQENSAFIMRYRSDRLQLYLHICYAYDKLNNYKELLFISNEAIKSYPSDPQFYYYAGLASARLGEIEEAVFFLTKATVMAPNYTDAYDFLAKIMILIGEKDLYVEHILKSERSRKEGSWKRPRQILDLHHFNDEIILFQIYR